MEDDDLPVDQLVGYFVNSPEFRDRLRNTFGSSEGIPQRCDFGDFIIYARSNDAIAAAVRGGQQYEAPVLAALSTRLGAGDTFVDVGASIGYFSVAVSRRVGEHGRVIAFEPGPQNQSLLLLNLTANRVRNADVRPVALSDRAETLAYSRLGTNGIVAAFDGDPSTLATHDLVRADTLDNVLGDQVTVDAMKIDVEGAEALVLRGAEKTLVRCKPFLVFEFSPPALETVSRASADALLRYIAEMGYDVCALRRAGEPLQREDASAIIDAFNAGDADHLDLAAWHSDT